MAEKDRESSPVALVQNPAFGALLLWNFGKAFQKEKITDIPALNLHFLVLPLLLHAKTLEHISSTYPRSGLTQVTKKLSEHREQLFAIHSRTQNMKELTLASVASGITSKILHLNYNNGKLRSNDARPPATPERLKYHVRGAVKLGTWFGRLSPQQVFSLLRVEP